MPTSNQQINDPEGQSVMDAFTEAGVDPGAAYNATQGVYNMSGDKVIAEIGVMRADVKAALAEIGAHINALSARVDTLETTTAVRLDAVDAQMAMLTWAMIATFTIVIATFTIVTAIAATGFFRKGGWWTRGNSGSGPATSQSSDG